MKSTCRTVAAAVLASLFILTCPVMASGGGGSSSTEEGDSNAMVYITIGVAVLVGGLLVLDVLAGPDAEPLETEPISDPIVETGINWDEAFPVGTAVSRIAVSVFPGENGMAAPLQMIEALNELGGGNIVAYTDPVDLGTGSPVDRARMASEFFQVDYLIFQVMDAEGLQFGLASPDSVLWTSTLRPDNSMLLIAEELIQSGVITD